MCNVVVYAVLRFSMRKRLSSFESLLFEPCIALKVAESVAKEVNAASVVVPCLCVAWYRVRAFDAWLFSQGRAKNEAQVIKGMEGYEDVAAC